MANNRVIRSLLVCASLLPVSVAGGVAAPVVGAATDLASQQPLYTETHCSTADAQVRRVIYRDTLDQLLAIKRLDFQPGKATPSYEQHSLYAGETTAVAVRGGSIEMRVTQDSGVTKMATASADTRLPLVVDAGFDAFVRDNWSALIGGQTMRFQFPLAQRGGLVNLRIGASACSYETGIDQCFRLEPDNWALRLLADPIELGYDPATARLLRYRGLSNIGDGRGGGQVVDIRYRYDGSHNAACDVELPQRDNQATG